MFTHLANIDLLEVPYKGVAADPAYTGKVTVPTLWDRKRRTIVNNESSEIIRMLGHAFDGIGARSGDYCPQSLVREIDERIAGPLKTLLQTVMGWRPPITRTLSPITLMAGKREYAPRCNVN